MSEWIKSTIEIVAAGGTLWAAIAARQSAKISRQQLEGQIYQRELIDLPRLVPLNTYIHSKVSKMDSDWQKIDESKLNDDFDENKVKKPIDLTKIGKFSSFTLPLINTGKLFALDVRYNYVFEGGRDAVRNYDFEDAKIKVLDSEKGQLDSDAFEFTFTQKVNGHDVTRPVEVRPFARFIPIIKSEEIVELLIPSYFVLLSNIFLKSNWMHMRKSMNQPRLILNLRYTDQYYQIHRLTYRMTLSLKQVNVNKKIGVDEEFNDDYIKTWIDFELINSTIEKKSYRLK